MKLRKDLEEYIKQLEKDERNLSKEHIDPFTDFKNKTALIVVKDVKADLEEMLGGSENDR